MEHILIAKELVKVAKSIISSDMWHDEKTSAFAKEVAAVMRGDVTVTGINKNVIEFTFDMGVVSVPLILTLWEYGYEEPESVQGEVTSSKDKYRSLATGSTDGKDRNAKELWTECFNNMKRIMSMALKR